MVSIFLPCPRCGTDIAITMSPALCLTCGLVSLVNESKEEQSEKIGKWVLTPVDLFPARNESDFTRLVDEEFFSHNVRWLLEGFCSTSNGTLGISSGWIGACEDHQMSTLASGKCNKCESISRKSHYIDHVGVGIFSCWSVHSSSGYSALLVIYDSEITANIYDEIQKTKPKKLVANYLKFTSRIFDVFLNSILKQSTYEYTGRLTSGTTSLSQYGEGSGLLVFGEAGKDKDSNSPLLPYTSPHSGEFMIYDIFQQGNKKVATLIIPSRGAEILNLKKQSNGTLGSGPFEVRNFGMPIDLFTAILNSGVQFINQEMIRGKSVDPSFEALLTCRRNFWDLLARSISEEVDFEEVVMSAYAQKEQEVWRDVVLQLRGRRPESI